MTPSIMAYERRPVPKKNSALLIILITLFALALFADKVLLATPVKAETPLDDRVLEAKYCHEWLDGQKVAGGTDEQIKAHCARFL